MIFAARIPMKKITFLYNIAFIIVFLLHSTGCSNLHKIFEVVTPETAYENKQYDIAAGLLQDAYKSEKNLQEQAKIAYKIGECYRFNNKTDKAEEWYKKAMDLTGDAPMMYKYGLMLKANGKYEEAEKLFIRYVKSFPVERAFGKKQLNSVMQSIEWKAKPTPHQLTNLDINSSASDYAPVLYGNNKFVFSSARKDALGEDNYGWTGEKHSDIFISNLIDYKQLSGVNSIGAKINSRYNEGTCSFTADGKTMYFTRCGSDGKRNDYCQIYKSQFTDKSWSEPERIQLFESDSINVGQPFITMDSKNLYFSANSPDGVGDKDIYMAEYKNGEWTNVRNLGPEINTSAYEGFPYIGIDGLLYFASNGHVGMGGLDIFKAKKNGKKWTDVENLKYPMNSPADDFGLIFIPAPPQDMIDEVQSMGYFTSSRNGGRGNDDIYAFIEGYPKPEIIDTSELIPQNQVVYILKGTVKQKTYKDAEDPKSTLLADQKSPEALVEILGLDLSSRIDDRTVTDESGKFTSIIEANSEYKITISKNGYFTQSIMLNSKEAIEESKDTFVVNTQIVLDKIFRQKEIVLPNIYYDLDSYAIRSDAKPVLDKLALTLTENPDLHIELGSHTDSRGTAKYNLTLSQNRAQSVVDYLVTKGIDRTRMIARGYGESLLVNNCSDNVNCPEEKHQENRRTTFKVL